MDTDFSCLVFFAAVVLSHSSFSVQSLPSTPCKNECSHLCILCLGNCKNHSGIQRSWTLQHFPDQQVDLVSQLCYTQQSKPPTSFNVGGSSSGYVITNLAFSAEGRKNKSTPRDLFYHSICPISRFLSPAIHGNHNGHCHQHPNSSVVVAAVA
uniref:Expressed conserved protein n=1 Tax=Mesocestoides corti TaxID=53468 RepID=A0A5K3G5E8_MESCO